MGPILAAIKAAPIMMATATTPAPWPPFLSQHDGLHMTGRLAVGSVKHATHLFLSIRCREELTCGWPGWRVAALQARHQWSERGLRARVKQAHGRLVDVGDRQIGALVRPA